jgi:hypothetical protein
VRRGANFDQFAARRTLTVSVGRIIILGHRLGSAKMDISWPVLYRIDIEDRLAEFNDGWLAFAQANGGHALHPSNILGRSLWDFVADAETSHLYQVMVQRLRQGGPPTRFRFRCDAPDRRRLLAMEITGDKAGGIQFSVSSVLEDPRVSLSLLDPAHPRAEHLLTMCSWCKRARLPPERWVEIEQAVEELNLFDDSPLPGVTHGICPACHEAMVGALADPAKGTAGTVTLGAIHPA